jgi:hypothetical protein
MGRTTKCTVIYLLNFVDHVFRTYVEIQRESFGLKPAIESLQIPQPEGWGYRDFNNSGL